MSVANSEYTETSEGDFDDDYDDYDIVSTWLDETVPVVGFISSLKYIIVSWRSYLSSDKGIKKKRKKVLPNVEDRTLTVAPLFIANVKAVNILD